MSKKTHSLLIAITLVSCLGLPAPVHAANVTVNVDYTSTRQTVEGFGASVTWVANDLDAFSASKQTQILDLLYATFKPAAGLSWVRVGSFLRNFNPSPGVFDWNYWGIQSGMRWLQRVNTAYGVNRYMVSTWSPPAWMKDNNSCTSGGHGITPPTSVVPYRTSATENQAQLGPISVSGGAFTITVPTKSVVTVVG